MYGGDIVHFAQHIARFLVWESTQPFACPDSTTTTKAVEDRGESSNLCIGKHLFLCYFRGFRPDDDGDLNFPVWWSPQARNDEEYQSQMTTCLSPVPPMDQTIFILHLHRPDTCKLSEIYLVVRRWSSLLLIVFRWLILLKGEGSMLIRHRSEVPLLKGLSSAFCDLEVECDSARHHSVYLLQYSAPSC